MESQSNTVKNVGGELLSDAKGVGSSAVNRLHSEVDNRKSGAVTQVKAVSSAVGQAAQSLDDNAPEWLKKTFQQGAEQVQKFADAIEQKDSRQLVSDVGQFARISPGPFMLACAAAGFAAARILKVGSTDNQPDNQPSQLGSVNLDDQTFQSFETSTPSAVSGMTTSSQGELV